MNSGKFASIVKDTSFEKEKKKLYVDSLRRWKAPKCLRDDILWFAGAYEKGELQTHEGKYAILGRKMLMKETFTSASNAANFLEKSSAIGLIIFVGPNDTKLNRL